MVAKTLGSRVGHLAAAGVTVPIFGPHHFRFTASCNYTCYTNSRMRPAYPKLSTSSPFSSLTEPALRFRAFLPYIGALLP